MVISCHLLKTSKQIKSVTGRKSFYDSNFISATACTTKGPWFGYKTEESIYITSTSLLHTSNMMVTRRFFVPFSAVMFDPPSSNTLTMGTEGVCLKIVTFHDVVACLVRNIMFDRLHVKTEWRNNVSGLK